jgi:transposase
MLKVNHYDYVRTAHRVYGKKIREISRETGHSKNTVKKILRGEYSSYKERENQPYPVLGPYIKIIDKWLEEDKVRDKKQRHTGVRVYQRLKQEHDYSGGESTVRRYVREAKIRLGMGEKEAFIPLEPPIGKEAEVDWGTAQAVIGGEDVTLKLFCMRSKYSGKHFVRCYPCERQQALFDAHIRGFAFFGGIFPILIYDNMTTAVQKVFQGKERRLQHEYSRFQSYYNFTPRFCNPGKGHEKGGVEGLVGYSRRNYMVPVPEAESLEKLNENLLRNCLDFGEHRYSGREKTVNEYFDEEKSSLLALPSHEFTNILTIQSKVDKYSTVLVDKNRYSVPTQYTGRGVNVLLSVDMVKIYWDNKPLSSHARLYGSSRWSLEPFHYLELIQKRPQAFDSARPLKQWRKEWPESLERLLERFCAKQGHTKGVRDFISVLMFYSHYPKQTVEAAVEQALEGQISSSDGVKHLLVSMNKKRDEQFSSLDNWESLPAPNISVYGELGGGI